MRLACALAATLALAACRGPLPPASATPPEPAPAAPALRADPAVALAVAALSGLFSGIFAGRTVRLLRLALCPAVSCAMGVPAFNA